MSPSQRCLALLLGTAFIAPQVAGSAEPTLLTRIELERGRALIVDDSGVTPLRRHEGPRTLPGPGHFELAPGSEAVLRWPGKGSLHLAGPASMFNTMHAAEIELNLRFSTMHAAEIELRQGSARLDMPGAWRVELDAGAYSLRALPGGGATFKHHAGNPVRASWIGGAGVSAPQWLTPGAELRLTGTSQAPLGRDSTAAASDWPAVAWPWGSGAINDIPDLPIPGSKRWPDGDWPWGTTDATNDLPAWERWDWPWGAWVEPKTDRALVTLDPAKELPSALDPQPGQSLSGVDSSQAAAVASRQAAGEPSRLTPDAQPDEDPLGELDSKVEPAPVGESEPDSVPASELPEAAVESGKPEIPQAQPAAEIVEAELALNTPEVREPFPGPAPAFPKHSWRGLDRAQLDGRGEFVLQFSEDWIHETLADGQQRFSVDSGSQKPAWFFGAKMDYRVFPGASLLVGTDGEVISHDGWVRILGVTSGRAPLEQY